jgi:site-specific DNA-cytosine methylase
MAGVELSEEPLYSSAHGVGPVAPATSSGEAVDPSQLPSSYIDTFNPRGPAPPASNVTKTKNGWVLGYAPARTAAMSEEIDALIQQHRDQFSWSLKDLGSYCGPEGPARFPLIDENKRYYASPRRMAHFERQIEQQKVPPLIEAGLVVRVPMELVPKYAANAVIAAKKDSDGAYTDTRYCLNYKPINQGLLTDNYRLPRIDQLHQEVAASPYKSKIDARSGYLQVPVAPEDQAKTAFWYDGDLWMHKTMPFGLKTAPALYQRRMNEAIKQHGLEHCCCCYIDDVLVFSKDWASHLSDLTKVFQMLKDIGIKGHPDKSIFAAETVEFLGHNVSSWGLSPSEAKVAAIKVLPEPDCVATLRRVLGFLNYYRDYCPNFSAVAAPLTALTCKGADWLWRPEVEGAAFHVLKARICEPGRALKRADPERPYVLHTDWSKHGMGAVLGQLDDDGKEAIVCCISRSLNKAEREYASYKGEMLGAVWAVKALDYYLKGAKFTLVTDHQPLTFLMTNNNLQGQYARWSLILQEYDFEIKHRPGNKHQNADALSRHPLESSEDNTGARLDMDAVTVQVLMAAQMCEEQVDDSEWQAATGGWTPSEWAAFGLLSIGQLSSLLADFPVGEAPVDTSDSEDEQQAMASLEYELHVAACLAFSVAPDMDSYVGHYGDEVVGEAESEDADVGVCSLMAALHPEHTAGLHRVAASWVANTAGTLPAPGPYTQLSVGGDSSQPNIVSIDSQPLPAATVMSMASTGVTLFEPFGGLAAGLEMLLRNGIPVRRYLYSDVSPAAVSVARHRLQQLSERYGQRLLPPTAYADTFGETQSREWRPLPMDVWEIDQDRLIQAGALNGQQWMVVAGWECQDLSPAGAGRGLSGHRSNSFFPLLHILGTLQQLQSPRPPAYLLENTAMQCSHQHQAQLMADYQRICDAVGQCVLLDAAQVGAKAHRLRDYWTNLADVRSITAVLAQARPDPGARLMDILEPGRRPQLAEHSDTLPRYPINVCGQTIRALPTLMATVDSYAFRNGGAGMVIGADGQLAALTINERERAVGYPTNCTNAPGVSERERHAITGRCMDAHAMQYLFATAMALRISEQQPGEAESSGPAAENSTQPGATVSCGASAQQLGGGRIHWDDSFCSCSAEEHPAAVFRRNVVAAALTEAQDTALTYSTGGVADAEYTHKDVWLDSLCMEYVREGEFGAMTVSLSSKEQLLRAMRRAKSYRMAAGRLYRQLADGQAKEVPEPAARKGLVREMHERCGHFGRRRTLHLVLLQYWWAGVYQDVRDCARSCEQCSRVGSSSFSAQPPELQPLPIMGMFYRWHVDLAGPFPVSAMGHRYVMVCVEAFSKHAEMIPISQKSAEHTAYAFTHNVICRFGACAEVVTDQGTEWDSSFYELLSDSFIDHRRTSANRPQSNGLAERCVQTIKACLQKQLDGGSQKAVKDWDKLVAWIALAYRASPQASTGMSPYQMLFAVAPTVPPNIKQRISEPINMDDTTATALELARRASLMERSCIAAGHNLMIAQHRDTLRYAKLRSGAYLPKIRRYEAGDYVYVKYRTVPHSLEPHVRPEILRVLEVRVNPGRVPAVLRLQGRDGKTVDEHVNNCVPCHLPISEQPMQYGTVTVDQPCQGCGFPDDYSSMLLCDGCNLGWHLYCLQPPLEAVPAGSWFCQQCRIRGGDTMGRESPAVDTVPEITGSGEGAAAGPDAQAGGLRTGDGNFEGRVVLRQRSDAAGLRTAQRGVAHYLGPEHHPACYEVRFSQGAAERLTARQVRHSVLPAGEPLPEVQQEQRLERRRSSRAAHRAAAVSGAERLPDQFDLMTTEGVTEALGWMMPGEWTARQARQVSGRSGGGSGRLQWSGERQQQTTAGSGVELLLAALDFSTAHVVVDMFASNGDIKTTFGGAAITNNGNGGSGGWPGAQGGELPGSQAQRGWLGAQGGELPRSQTQGGEWRPRGGEPAGWLGARGGSVPGPGLQGGGRVDRGLGGGPDSWGVDRSDRGLGGSWGRTRGDLGGAADYGLSALQPATYRRIKEERGLDAVIMRPLFTALDLALPLAVEFTTQVVCCQIPGKFLTDAPVARMQWLRQLQQEERLMWVAGRPQVPNGHQCIWLVVFRSAAVRDVMRRQGAGADMLVQHVIKMSDATAR